MLTEKCLHGTLAPILHSSRQASHCNGIDPQEVANKDNPGVRILRGGVFLDACYLSVPSLLQQSLARAPMLLVIIMRVARARSSLEAPPAFSAMFICPKLEATISPDNPNLVGCCAVKELVSHKPVIVTTVDVSDQLVHIFVVSSCCKVKCFLEGGALHKRINVKLKTSLCQRLLAN